jgi:hypothetical protein
MATYHPTDEELSARRYGRRAGDTPELARIFTAPFAAHVAGLIQSAVKAPVSVDAYGPKRAASLGRLKNKQA